jgi:putative Holliday junction resolvase
MKYLAIDFGLRNIGLASGDDETNLAFPIGNIRGGEEAIPEILSYATKESVDALVIGLPIPDVHQNREQLERTKRFVQQVHFSTMLPIYVVDEQFSSAEARRIMKEGKDTWRLKQDIPEDAIAATIILQAFLDGDRDLTIDTATKREE